MDLKKNCFKLLKRIGVVLLIIFAIGLFFPTWTPKIEGENSISELSKVEINGDDIQIMIRGCDKNNPILLFVHGGPCCSEIPYVVKYQKEWEEKFTVVHYDQRGSGKSFQFFKDYSDVSANTHIEDLIGLTKYITKYIGQKQVILLGHSYGTYIATQAAAQRPELYQAYVGIGQVSNKRMSELDSLEKCLAAAEAMNNTADVKRMEQYREAIELGEGIMPRQYVRKYGFAARQIDDNADYLEGFLLRPEYNLLDMIRFWTASGLYQDRLWRESLQHSLVEVVTELKLPVYFHMGKYDGMTSPEAAQDYLKNLSCPQGKEFILYEYSAHYPQFEESELFYSWLCETFVDTTKSD